MPSTPQLERHPGDPRHIAIIMDGNGRWAKQRKLPRLEGHRRGVDAVDRTVEAMVEFGIPYLTLYAFSVENWQRPQDEVRGLMELLDFTLKRYTKKLIKNGVRLRTIGKTEALPRRLQDTIARTIEQTARFDEHTLIMALNYGSRQEVLDAVAHYAAAARDGKEDPEQLDWPAFAKYLDTADYPEPDLLIRTSGESRISNFLLVQCAYTELAFIDKPWPEFGPTDLAAAIHDYRHRERRFGKTGEQLKEVAPVGVPGL